jgi:hypothetical protein
MGYYVTRINCLTGAIISETYITNKYIYITTYDPPQYSIFIFPSTTVYTGIFS